MSNNKYKKTINSILSVLSLLFTILYLFLFYVIVSNKYVTGNNFEHIYKSSIFFLVMSFMSSIFGLFSKGMFRILSIIILIINVCIIIFIIWLLCSFTFRFPF